jgi:hypothetical protein
MLTKLVDGMNYHHMMLNLKTAAAVYDTNAMVSNKGVDD